MADRDDEHAYGTAEHTAPVTRADFERAVRSLNMSDLDLRDSLLQLAARVVALTDELTRRLDGVEPHPAPPNTRAATPVATVEAVVAATLGGTLKQIRAADAGGAQRVSLDTGPDKYEVTPSEIPCAELLAICEARCCKLTFALSTADLDEGVIRWDYGQPYLIRQRASDAYCVHNDPATRGCSVHHFRPRVCRQYDCRKDERIWASYEQRTLAPMPQGPREADPRGGPAFDLMERARARAIAVHVETAAISESYADHEPARGPAPRPPAAE